MEKSKLDKETSEVGKKNAAQYSHIDEDKGSRVEQQGYPRGDENKKVKYNR